MHSLFTILSALLVLFLLWLLFNFDIRMIVFRRFFVKVALLNLMTCFTMRVYFRIALKKLFGIQDIQIYHYFKIFQSNHAELDCTKQCDIYFMQNFRPTLWKFYFCKGDWTLEFLHDQFFRFSTDIGVDHATCNVTYHIRNGFSETNL